MTVREFVELSIEPSFQEVELWSVDEDTVIYSGTVEDLLDDDDNDDFCEMEIGSFDVIDKHSQKLTLNVSDY